MVRENLIKKLTRYLTSRKLALAIASAPFLAASNSQAEEPKIKGGLSSMIADSYVARPGFVVSNRGVVQNSINLSFKNQFSFFSWSDFNLDTKTFDEVDAGFEYNMPLKNNLSARLNYQYWTYPSGEADADNVLEAGIHYTCGLEIDTTLTHLFSHGDVPTGSMIQGTLSKPFRILENNKSNISIAPNITITYLDNFYNLDGLSCMNPGIDFQYKKGPINLGLFIKRQHGFIDKIDNQTYYGVSLKLDF